MAVCFDCQQEMCDKVPCTAFPNRIPSDGGGDGHCNCHDCLTPPGGLHHPGCDMERCDHGHQAIDCDDCRDKQAQTGLDYWDRSAS